MSDTAETITWIGLAIAAVHLLVILAVAVRVLTRRRAPGSTAAWLLLVVMLPYAGVFLYLLIGERPLGRRRMRHVLTLRGPAEQWLGDLAERAGKLPPGIIDHWDGVRRLADRVVGIGALPGNHLELLDDTGQILRAIADDIDSAGHFCLLEFYIWNPGGDADMIAEALMRASGRGVACRVLLDSVGSAEFFRSAWPKRLGKAGVEVTRALPGGLLRGLFRRVDLRLHRKLVVVDGYVGYTGSLNLVDPRFFKEDAGVGQWVDAMTRVQGPAVEALAGLFAWDWALETDTPLDLIMHQVEVPLHTDEGRAVVQMVPSGPGYDGQGVIQLVLSAIYGAQQQLVLTTPYFVPSCSLVEALCSAAMRGVDVKLVVPAKVDSKMVHYASRAWFDDLLEAGVGILQFDGGLLHTKSIVVDQELAFFGTLNLDIRSFQLNFELTLLVYDQEFAAMLSRLTDRYIDESEPLAEKTWARRSRFQRMIENLAQMMSPLL